MENTSFTAPSSSFFTSRLFLLLSLLFANALTIVLFITQHGSFMQAVWTYWVQSVIIGAVNVVRIWQYKPSWKGVSVANGQQITEAQYRTMGKVARVFMTGFFMCHYGFFMLIYFIFLTVFSISNMPITVDGVQHTLNLGGHISIISILGASVFFAIHHIASYIEERHTQQRLTASQTGTANYNVVSLMAKPYLRILPLHLTIILAPMILFSTVSNGETWAFAFFLALKTAADVMLFLAGTGHIKPTQPPTPPKPATLPT